MVANNRRHVGPAQLYARLGIIPIALIALLILAGTTAIFSGGVTPAKAAGEGTFSFSAASYSVTEGGSVIITGSRVGQTGPAVATLTFTGCTVAGDCPAPGVLTFSGVNAGPDAPYTYTPVNDPVFGTRTATVSMAVSGAGVPPGVTPTINILNGSPTVTSVSPPSGPPAGGTPVTITGTNFNGATLVTFNGAAATSVVVVNGTSITAVTPAGVGLADVRVSTTSLSPLSNAYTYTGGGGAPTITAMNPTSGSYLGGNLVQITGTNFVVGLTSVTFGGVAGTSVTVTGTTFLSVISPAGPLATTVQVRVITASGTSPDAGLIDDYLYTGFASGTTITSLSPNFGPACGGNQVIIYGSGFTGTTNVSFGGFTTTGTINSDVSITAIAPAICTSGAVNVSVTSPTGTNVPTAGSLYTYGTSCSYSNCCGNGYTNCCGNGYSNCCGNGYTTNCCANGYSNTCCPYGGATNCCTNGYNNSCCANGYTTNCCANGYNNNTTNCCANGYNNNTSNCCQYGYNSNCCQNGGYSNCCSSTYYANCVIAVTSISPISGPAGGGNSVTINGSGFLGAVSVHFGSVSATFTVNSDNAITAVAPAASTSTGTIYITVTGYGGATSSSNGSSQYLYLGGAPSASAPVATSLSPTSGPVNGGTTVVITGYNFLGASGVVVGGVGTTFTVLSDTQIRILTPPEPAGPVGVTVTTSAGSSSALTFTYTPNGPGPGGPQYCPMIPLWVNDLLYGNPGGGFYWDPVSGLVWTPARGWHSFAPQPFRFTWLPLWADAPTYGSIGQGFWWDPTSGLVWTSERGWHLYSPQGCIPR